MKKKYSITVKGNQTTWDILFVEDEESIKDWKADGVDVDEITKSIPEIINNLRLTRPWAWLQDKGHLPI